MILLSAAIVVVAATVLFTLFVRVQDLPPADPVSPTKHLDEKKAAIYENLRDLQFEFRVGKLSDADYQLTKLGLQKELAVVMAEIDKVMSGQSNAASGPASAPKPKKEAKPEGAGTVCPHCAATFPKPLKFCGECGKAMA